MTKGSQNRGVSVTIRAIYSENSYVPLWRNVVVILVRRTELAYRRRERGQTLTFTLWTGLARAYFGGWTTQIWVSWLTVANSGTSLQFTGKFRTEWTTQLASYASMMLLVFCWSWLFLSVFICLTNACITMSPLPLFESQEKMMAVLSEVQQMLVQETGLNSEGNSDESDDCSNTEYCSCPQGFFRRSIQQKIQYRPCTKNQQCAILRINRNRCQYCRLKKCITVGMSRDGEYLSNY